MYITIFNRLMSRNKIFAFLALLVFFFFGAVKFWRDVAFVQEELAGLEPDAATETPLSAQEASAQPEEETSTGVDPVILAEYVAATTPIVQRREVIESSGW